MPGTSSHSAVADHDTRDASEPYKQRLGCLLARLRSGTLRIGRSLGGRLDVLAADSEAVDPERRVALVAAAQERDPLVDHGQADAADGVVVERASVDVAALDQQVREEGTGCTQLCRAAARAVP
jgi:hypothetical protein